MSTNSIATAGAADMPRVDAEDEVRNAIADENWARVHGLASAGLETDSEDARSWFLVGLAAFHEGNLSVAVNAALEALEGLPNASECARFLAVCHALAGDITNSLYYGKLMLALSSDPGMATWLPESFPRFETVFQNISEAPLLMRAREALAEGSWADAESWFHQHLAFHTTDREAHLGLATASTNAGEHRSAIEGLRVARHVLPEDAEIASRLGGALTTVGDYAAARACHRWACRSAPEDPSVFAMALMDSLYNPDRDPADVAANFRAWGERFGEPDDDMGPHATAQPKDRLTLGYMVGGQGTTPDGVNLSQILTMHDVSRFQTVGFGFGALSDDSNLIFQKCMDQWQDIVDIDPITLRAMVAEEHVDILIDACGFSSPRHLVAFGARMAPCQVAWLGTPLGTGLAAMDHMLSDETMEADGSIPLREATALLALGASVARPMMRDSTPLADRPEGPITFAADVALAELNPRTVEAWARILHRVPGSTLIVRDQGYQSGENLNRLTSLFGDFGLAHRVDVIDEDVPSQFFAQADIALMPVTFPRPHVAAEALWGGVPVACMAGRGRHARQAASFLEHLKLDMSLLAEDEDALVDLAVNGANDANGRADFRASIRDRLKVAESLDPGRRIDDLETVLTDLWRRAGEGC